MQIQVAAGRGGEISLCLAGDVMTGRGIDQILAHPGEPKLHEPFVKSARRYVDLAVRESGPIALPVSDNYIWGDALSVCERLHPQARIINVETAVTASCAAWPGKGIHYRMHPANIGAIAAFRPDCCVLANNHVLDWGRRGLRETLRVLAAAGLQAAGAGRDQAAATAPAAIAVAGRRLLVFAFALPSSGVPPAWAAHGERSGIAWLPDLSTESISTILAAVERYRQRDDRVLVSLHWGGNWGYAVTAQERHFAQQLVAGGVDLVHGHSSHHAKGIEVYRQRLILYGCGDLLNDYEGIGGYRHYRPDLALLYFPSLEEESGRLRELLLVPTRIERFSLHLAAEDDVEWLRATVDREGRPAVRDRR